MHRVEKWFACLLLVIALAGSMAAQSGAVPTAQFSRDVTEFLGRELTAHVADIHSLNPPQDRVLGALSTGDFSWGSFMRSLASYSALSGQRTIGGRDVARMIGEIGLIESRNGGRTFAQVYGAIALRHFGADLKTNAVWQALTPEEKEAWRSLLDPSRFYDRKTRKVINLAENYFGVAARVVSLDYQMGFITDRAFVDDVLDRAAEQFTRGNLYSDDALPTGRFDRYSNEYARSVYLAAEGVGRTDVMKALEPTLKAQIRLWWDVISPDGYGYPWGRSLGTVSYADTVEIVAFLAKHPQFRPAPLPQLASAYYASWQWLSHDIQPERHLLNVFGYGRGNYNYINKQREWQQTTDLLGKVAGAQIDFTEGLQRENVTSFPAKLTLPEQARFEFFRNGDRPAGVWMVRKPQIRFVLPFVTGVVPGASDYLPAPYNLVSFAPPVQQQIPTATPYLELADGRVIVAGDGADEIVPSADGMSVRARWRRWAVLGAKAGQLTEPGLTAEVTWTVQDNALVRTEVLTASKPLTIARFWVVVPSTGTICATRFEKGLRIDRFDSTEGSMEVSVPQSDWPLNVSLLATGDSAAGKGSRGPVPFHLNMEAHHVTLSPGISVKWTLVLRAVRQTR